MKRNRCHILLSRLLLLIFVVGQVALYGHQHKLNTVLNNAHSGAAKQIITEKCQLCDVMHHNTMAIKVPFIAPPVIASHYDYNAVTYTFVSFSLILSTGRAPPIS